MPIQPEPPKPVPEVIKTVHELRSFIDRSKKPDLPKTKCDVLAEETLHILRTIRKEGLEGVGELNSYLKKNHITVEAPHGAVFALNIILHVFVLFLALTMLYIFVISPLESSTLQGEVDDKLTEALQSTWNATNPEAQTVIGNAIYVAMPALDRAALVYSKPDEKRKANNQNVFIRAGLISFFLLVLFIIVAAVLASCHVNLASHIKHVLGENAIIFIIIGVVEFMFFTFVAKKFVPTMPSQLGTDALNAARQVFSTTFTGAPA